MSSITRTLAVAAIFAATALPAAAQTTAPPRILQRLDVLGQGSVDRMPDRVTVAFQVVSNDDVAARATSQNNTTYAALLAKMRALGIPDASIRTTGYDLSDNPRPAQPNPQSQQRYGYVVTRNVTVSSDRTDQAGAIVDAGVAAGAASVGGVDFGLRDARAAYRAAQAAAVADAEAQAQGLAASAHLRVVRVLMLSTAPQAEAPRPVIAGRMAVVAAVMPTDVQPSSLTVTATVTATYQIAP